MPWLHDMGIGIGVMSYHGLTCWGITADKDIVPNLGAFMAALRQSVVILQSAAKAARTSGRTKNGDKAKAASRKGGAQGKAR